MNLLLLFLGLATAQAGSINRQRRRQAAYESPCGLATRLRALNPSFPGTITREADQQQLIHDEQFVSSTPGYYELNRGVLAAGQPISEDETGKFEANQQLIHDGQFVSSTPGYYELNRGVLATGQPLSIVETNKFEANQQLIQASTPEEQFASSTPGYYELNRGLFAAGQPISTVEAGKFEAEQPVLNLHTGKYEAASGHSSNAFEADRFLSQLQGDFQHTKASISGHPGRVLKSFYFFAAPEERATVRSKIRLVQPSTKHVNVIFIKAPEAPKVEHVVESQPNKHEEKTLVYVLVKNPQESQEVTVEAGEPAKPPKPEVFFLKYSNEEEARAAVEEVKLQQQNHGGAQVEILDGGSEAEAGGGSGVLAVLKGSQRGGGFSTSRPLSIGGGFQVQVDGSRVEAGGASEVSSEVGGGLQELLPPVSDGALGGFFVSTTVAPVKTTPKYLPPF
ncbi:unnamed protein product [Phyllotreta striolata]|uniref:DUF243 domain-containing protein n=1 Tax=Phyllotreta striolata TaxID=444603 RepID=A0A9N9TKY5_PHYSR|nr:unnamed protein product [Phyllotreta striolata]